MVLRVAVDVAKNYIIFAVCCNMRIIVFPGWLIYLITGLMEQMGF